MMTTFTQLFFPKKIKNYYLFSTPELSLYIKEQSLHASLFILKGEVKTLSQNWFFEYDKYEELLAHIQTIYNVLPLGTAIKVILESSSLFFKKIDLPFNDYEKIQATLPFELESFLPISLQESAFDFVVTDYHNGISSLLVAVIHKKILDEKLKPFTDLNITIDYVSIDTIELYRISHLFIDNTVETLNIFISLEDEISKILLFNGTHLLNVRTLLKKSAAAYDDLIFTIDTYCPAELLQAKKVTITLFQDNPDLSTILNKNYSTQCMTFNKETFFKKNKIINACNADLTKIAYPCILTPHQDQEFNINHHATSTAEFLRFQTTLITTAFLSLSVVGLLGFHIVSQIGHLQNRLMTDQNKIIGVMKKTFPSVEQELTKLVKKSKKGVSHARQISEALTLAHKDISQESSILSAFSAQNRGSFLEYLATLTAKIDRETLGLELKKMVLNKNTIILEGRVRNFEALEQFEKALKETELFSSIPDMQKVDFSISLPLAQKGALS